MTSLDFGWLQVPALAKSRTRAASSARRIRPLSAAARLPRPAVVFVQSQRFTEVADRTVTVLTDPPRPQVFLASTVIGHHALGELHPALQRAHLLILRRQGQQHQRLATRLGQRLALPQWPNQQGIGLLLQALASTLQAAAGQAVIRVFLPYRQPQRNRASASYRCPSLNAFSAARRSWAAAALPVDAWRCPPLHVLGGILTGNGDAALPGPRCRLRQ